MDMETSKGVIDLEDDEIMVFVIEKRHGIVGRFVGRFPGMRAIDGLAQSWGVNCRSKSSSQWSCCVLVHERSK